MRGLLKMTFDIKIPKDAESIINRLNEHGYESYIVGGCVRDSILGRTPNDWDICTSATPDKMIEIFADHEVIPTGLQHGTVTVVINHTPYECTTFRIDGDYSDNRRPDRVEFTTDIIKDLSRRDFTINAMAYNPQTGLVDPFGGAEDIKGKVIRCVGNADDRFDEDALRVMRALRFASVYGFVISEDTSSAIHRKAENLNNIAVERINTELCKLVCGKGVLDILLNYSDVISTIIPEIRPCIGFNQNNRYHQYTIYDHIAHAVSNYTGSDIIVKIALLLHDIGKPTCYTEDENGGHFYGHGVPSRDIAECVVERLKFDNLTKKDVIELVLYHDAVIEPMIKVVKRWLNKVGEKQLFRLLDIRMADILAHAEGTQESRIERCVALRNIAEEVISSEQCFKLKDLAVNGNDLMDIGIPQGREIGNTLNWLLDMVINGEAENKKDELLNLARKNKENNYNV